MAAVAPMAPKRVAVHHAFFRGRSGFCRSYPGKRGDRQNAERDNPAGTLARFGFSWIDGLDDVLGAPEGLPPGFVRNLYRGPDIANDVRQISDTIQRIDGVTDLLISKGAGRFRAPRFNIRNTIREL